MDPPQQHAGRRRCREYLLALEQERRKIEVFKRELPLCLQLVIQTIEGMKSQMDGIGSEETVSDDHGGDDPVLEEFMPLKPSLSLSSEEHESAHDASAGVGKKEEAAETPSPATEAKRVTPDWLQSMELWTQESQQRSSSSLQALNTRKTGGAFQPFEKEKRPAELPASSTTAVDMDSCDDKAASTTDTAVDKEMNRDAKEKGKDNKGSKEAANRKPRRCWAPELHRRFLHALQQLGGAHVATPKQIRELMKVDGLTNDEVKSHLQKYRLHTARRPNTTTAQSISAASTAPQFVVVGGIWLPPPEYAAAQPQVYAPVATLPSGLQPSDGRCRGDSSTESPAVSSSSHTTSA